MSYLQYYRSSTDRCGATDGNGGTTCFGLPFGYDIVGKVGIGNIKKIKLPDSRRRICLLGELSNLFVRMKKIIPSNFYQATLGHTLVLGIALEQQAYFPESLGEKELWASFKISEGYCDRTLKMSEENKNKRGFMEQTGRRTSE